MIGSGLYEGFLRPLLFALDPETAHHLALRFLAHISTNATLLGLLRRFQPPPDPVSLFGVNFPNRIGLAAGLDKNGVALPAWAALGFGFVEIGTVTARPQPGNPKPRIFRFPQQQALINRLGFNNDGADVVTNRLRRWHELRCWPSVPVGINIGKSKASTVREAAADYLHSFRRLQRFADYVVLNVSSPNTPGLRDLQEADLMGSLLQDVQAENRSAKPVLIKIAPDISEAAIDRIVAVCHANSVAGIIATNTTTSREQLPPEARVEGGLSGAPLQERSTAVVRALAERASIPIIGCGGIMSGDSAREKIAAGASLIQVYTGLIYRGPGLLREIGAALAEAQ
jgi:dihydroorotate dehydrogenase